MPITGRQVIALQLIELGPEPPAEFRIFPFGAIETTKGTFLFDDQSAALALQHWQAWGNDLSIDYEHQALENGSGPAPAAGWFQLEARGDGLWAVNVRWTERAAALLRAREYRYFSPAFELDEQGRIVRLINLALTNLPAMREMEPLMAKATSQEGDVKTILKMLGMETGTEEQAGTAVTALIEIRNGVATLTEKQSPSEILGVLTAWKQAAGQVETLTVRVQTLESAAASRELDALISKGRTDGKLTPALEPWARELGQKDPVMLKSYLETAPRVIPEGGRTEPAHSKITAKEFTALTYAQKADLYLDDPETYAALKAAAGTAQKEEN